MYLLIQKQTQHVNLLYR